MIDAIKQFMCLIDAWQRGADADEYFIEIAALRKEIAEAEKKATLQEISDIGQELDIADRAYFAGKQAGIAESEAVKRKWVGLTNDEIKKVFEMDWNSDCPEWVIDFSKRVEAKLRERNT